MCFDNNWIEGEDTAENQTTMADTIEKPVDSGKTVFGISVNTGQICMGFEADARKNDSNNPIVCDFQRSG